MILKITNGINLVTASIVIEEMLCNTERIGGMNVHVSDTYKLRGVNVDGRKIEATLTIEVKQ